MDTRKVVLTRFNTGRERGVNTGVSTVEQPLQPHESGTLLSYRHVLATPRSVPVFLRIRSELCSAAMPTLLKWTYEGGAPDSAEAARRGEQRAFSGDKVEDDVFGTGVLDAISGSSAFINFGTAEATDIKQRTAEEELDE